MAQSGRDSIGHAVKLPPNRMNIASVAIPLWVGIADTRFLLMVLPCIDSLVLDFEPIIFGDLNGDVVVGFPNLIALFSEWGLVSSVLQIWVEMVQSDSLTL